MSMYYLRNDKTVKVDELAGGKFKYHYRKTRQTQLGEKSLKAVPTYEYKSFLDMRLDSPGLPLPKVSRRQRPVDLGDRCTVFGINAVWRLEKRVRNDELLVLSLVEGKTNFLAMNETEKTQWGLKEDLQLFYLRRDMEIRLYDPEILEYDPEDLSTYPCSESKGHEAEIRYMLLQLSGFSKTKNAGIIKTPEGNFIDIELFVVSLGVTLNCAIPSMGGCSSWLKGEDIEWALVDESFPGSIRRQENPICDTLGNIYLILRLVKNGKGISPFPLKGKTISDLFTVTWNTSFDQNSVEETSKILAEGPEYDDNIYRLDSDMFWRATRNGKYIELKQR